MGIFKSRSERVKKSFQAMNKLKQQHAHEGVKAVSSSLAITDIQYSLHFEERELEIAVKRTSKLP